jgi:putative flippase GtrA
MEQTQSPILIKKDYFLITFIGISFALFALPILKNLAISGITVNATTAIVLIIFFSVFANLALFIAALIAKKIPVVLQIAKFAAVGAFNTFLDWGIVNLLMAVTQIFAGFWYAIFNVISFLAANSGSYFWNKYWTFSSGKQNAEGGFLQFFGVTFIGLILKVSIAYGIVNWIALPAGMTAGRWANVGLALGTIVALVWNFLGYKFIVFKK